jgi:hypothetical protein
MAARPLFADGVFNESGYDIYVCTGTKRTIKNLEQIYTGQMLQAIKWGLTQNPGESRHLIDKHAQYVFVFMALAGAGLFMKIYDFHKNLDIGLDGYKIHESQGWTLEQRNKVMELLREIVETPNLEEAEIILQDDILDIFS